MQTVDLPACVAWRSFFFCFVLVPGRAVGGATGGFRVRDGMMALHRRIRDWTGYGGWYLRIGG